MARPGVPTFVRDLPVTAALILLGISVAIAFDRVLAGGRWVPALVAAVVLAHLVALAGRAFGRGPLGTGIASGLTLLAFLLVLAPSPGSPGSLLDAVGAGWRVVLDDPVPIRATDGVIVLAVLVVWVAAALADQLAFHRGAALGAVAPGLIVVVWCVALGTRADQWVTILVFGATTVVFLALQHQALLARRRTRIGSGRLVDAPGLVAVGVIVGVVAVVLGVAGAGAIPDVDQPIVDVAGVGTDGGNRTYRTSVPPLLDVGDQLRDTEVVEVFTVGADRPDYWRTTALDQYQEIGGGQWTLTAEGDDAVGQGLDGPVPADALVQRYRIGPLGERWMPAAFEAVAVSDPDTLVVRASTTLVSAAEVVDGQRYTVRSSTPPTVLDAREQEDAARSIPKRLEEFTVLPAGVPEVVRTEAARVTNGLESPLARAQALRDYFRDGSFTYDTSIMLGDDVGATVQFLRDRRGFCVQFASTYSLMARAVGLPARVAVGFTPGVPDPETGIYSVTNHDAHAWPEVWLAGVGWTHLFDPTPPSDGPGGSALPGEVPPTEAAPPGPGDPTSVPGETTPATDPTTAPVPSDTPDTAPGPTDDQSGGVTIAADPPSGPGASWFLTNSSPSPWTALICIVSAWPSAGSAV
ncbi:MAG: transglutaminaseTgpA domain-containing protein [Acidimicrobiia bacterium]